MIGGEDIVIATTTEAALACNANWAVRVLLKKTENANRYEVVSVAAGDGSPFAGELGADEILLVVHSDGVGSNKEGKAAALELAAGKLIHIEGLADGTITGLYAVVDEVPGPVTGDRGMVAFAIVSVIALAGAVVVKKHR